MRRKGTKKRIMVALMAVMLLMATSVTSFADSGLYTKTVYGHLEKVGANGAQAYTKNLQDRDSTAYAKLTVEYMSSLKNLYTTTPITKTAKTSATVSKAVTGSFVSAWSGHGVTRQEFELLIGSNG